MYMFNSEKRLFAILKILRLLPFSGCKVTTKYSFLQVLRVKTCKKMHISAVFVHKSSGLNK